MVYLSKVLKIKRKEVADFRAYLGESLIPIPCHVLHRAYYVPDFIIVITIVTMIPWKTEINSQTDRYMT